MRLLARAHCVLQVVLIGVLTTSVPAQEQDRCRVILTQSVGDRLTLARGAYQQVEQGDYQQQVVAWMCNNRGGTLGLDDNLKAGFIRGIPVQFGGDLDGDSATAWFDSHCGTGPRSIPVKQADAVVAQLVPLHNAEHWLACITHSAYDWQIRIRRAQDLKELAIKLAAVLDGSSIQLTATWQPPASGYDPPQVTSFLVFGADCPIRGSGFAIGAPLTQTSTMTCQRRGDSAVAFVLGTSYSPAAFHFPSVVPPSAESPRITSLAMPVGSLDGGAPLEDQAWSVTFPLSKPDAPGIGYLVAPEKLPDDRLALHDHHFLEPGTSFLDRRRSVITYGFERETAVLELEMIQHNNAIARVEGFAGNREDEMVSVGVASIDPGCFRAEYYEGQHCLFTFPHPRKARFFRVEMLETNSPQGFAVFRAYPRGMDHLRYLPQR